MSDGELAQDLVRVVNGDRDALQRLIVRYHAQLHAVVARRIPAALGARLDAEDVLQQTYVAAFRDVGNCTFETPAGFRKWLEAIALARLLDAQRALRRQKRDIARQVDPGPALSDSCSDLLAHLAAGDSTPSRKIRRSEAVAAVLSSLAQLSEARRTVIRQVYLEQRSVREVAERLNKSEAAIHQLCSRGLKDLREVLGAITEYLTHGYPSRALRRPRRRGRAREAGRGPRIRSWFRGEPTRPAGSADRCAHP